MVGWRAGSSQTHKFFGKWIPMPVKGDLGQFWAICCFASLLSGPLMIIETSLLHNQQLFYGQAQKYCILLIIKLATLIANPRRSVT